MSPDLHESTRAIGFEAIEFSCWAQEAAAELQSIADSRPDDPAVKRICAINAKAVKRFAGLGLMMVALLGPLLEGEDG